MEQNGFAGKHVMLDITSGSPEKLSDIKLMYEYLIGMTNLLEMTLIAAPFVMEFPFSNEANTLAKKLLEENKSLEYTSPTIKNFIEKVKRKEIHEAGISGICIWAESHCTSHTWRENNFNSLDIYSCKDFDHQSAINYVIDIFDVIKGTGSVVKRWTNKPHEITLVTLDLEQK